MHRQSVAARQQLQTREAAGDDDHLPLVLFVCVHNAGRSRMAEAFFNRMAKGRYRALSAGTEPAPAPHPEVVVAMKESGFNLGPEPGRLLTPELADEAIQVIGMGCAVEEACPALSVPIEDWALEDPKGKDADEVADIRDSIELRVRNLIGRLDREHAPGG